MKRFLFAAVAAIIYAVALWRRGAAPASPHGPDSGAA